MHILFAITMSPRQWSAVDLVLGILAIAVAIAVIGHIFWYVRAPQGTVRTFRMRPMIVAAIVLLLLLFWPFTRPLRVKVEAKASTEAKSSVVNTNSPAYIAEVERAAAKLADEKAKAKYNQEKQDQVERSKRALEREREQYLNSQKAHSPKKQPSITQPPRHDETYVEKHVHVSGLEPIKVTARAEASVRVEQQDNSEPIELVPVTPPPHVHHEPKARDPVCPPEPSAITVWELQGRQPVHLIYNVPLRKPFPRIMQINVYLSQTLTMEEANAVNIMMRNVIRDLYSRELGKLRSISRESYDHDKRAQVEFQEFLEDYIDGRMRGWREVNNIVIKDVWYDILEPKSDSDWNHKWTHICLQYPE